MVAQWKLFINCVNHNSAQGLVWRFQWSEGMGRKEIYMMLVKMNKGNLWQGDEAKFLDFMIIDKCGVDFGDLDYNQLGAKVDLDSGSHKNLDA
jgi:hypothetical protein